MEPNRPDLLLNKGKKKKLKKSDVVRFILSMIILIIWILLIINDVH